MSNIFAGRVVASSSPIVSFEDGEGVPASAAISDNTEEVQSQIEDSAGSSDVATEAKKHGKKKVIAKKKKSFEDGDSAEAPMDDEVVEGDTDAVEETDEASDDAVANAVDSADEIADDEGSDEPVTDSDGDGEDESEDEVEADTDDDSVTEEVPDAEVATEGKCGSEGKKNKGKKKLGKKKKGFESEGQDGDAVVVEQSEDESATANPNDTEDEPAADDIAVSSESFIMQGLTGASNDEITSFESHEDSEDIDSFLGTNE